MCGRDMGRREELEKIIQKEKRLVLAVARVTLQHCRYLEILQACKVASYSGTYILATLLNNKFINPELNRL